MADDIAGLEQARKLILAKQYDEARTLLRTIDHPKAKSWLAQLNKIAPEKPAPEQKTERPSDQFIDEMLEPEYTRSANIPIPPGQLFRATWLRIAVILLGGIPLLIVAVLLSWNWRRLEKPQWVWGSIAAVLLPVGLLFAVVLGANAFKLSNITSWGLFAGAAVLMFYDYSAIYVLQNGAYNTWKSGGRKTLLVHKYPLEQAALIGLVLVALATVGGSVYTLLQSRPKTFESEHVSLSYPVEWKLLDTSLVSLCAEENLKCVFILTKPLPAGPAVVLTEFEVREGVTAQALAQSLYDRLPDMGLQGDLSINQPRTQIIGGQRVSTLEYSVSDSSNPSASDAVSDFEELFILSGHTALEFRVASARCLTCVPSYREDVNQLFAGLQFKNLQPAA